MSGSGAGGGGGAVARPPRRDVRAGAISTGPAHAASHHLMPRRRSPRAAPPRTRGRRRRCTRGSACPDCLAGEGPTVDVPAEVVGHEAGEGIEVADGGRANRGATRQPPGPVCGRTHRRPSGAGPPLRPRLGRGVRHLARRDARGGHPRHPAILGSTTPSPFPPVPAHGILFRVSVCPRARACRAAGWRRPSLLASFGRRCSASRRARLPGAV